MINLLATPNGRQLMRLTLAQADGIAGAAQERELADPCNDTSGTDAAQVNAGHAGRGGTHTPPLGTTKSLFLKNPFQRSAELIVSNKLMEQIGNDTPPTGQANRTAGNPKGQKENPMFLPTTTKKPFASLFSKEAREVNRLKNGIAANKARFAELTNNMRAMKAATTKGSK